MNAEVSTQQTKELLKGVLALTKLLLHRFKDGFQLDDLPVILSKLGYDPTFREAVKGVSEVPNELKNLDMSEVVELVMLLVQELPQLLKGGTEVSVNTTPDSDL